MKDRVPIYPGRVILTPVHGHENTYDMVRADEPAQEGTPLSKATFLKDATAAMFGLGRDAVPDDVLSILSAASITKKVPRYTQTTIGGLKVGSIVKLNVNGIAKEFIVVHHGKPSSLYDDSCNGTWLLMKDVYESRQWHRSDSNSYKDSTIHSYLNSTFLNMFDADIKAQIKSVKIPYVNGTSSGGSVASGANGLSAQIFLLSCYEFGWKYNDSYQFFEDGAKLDYFASGNTTAANDKRIANLNGTAWQWVSRSPVKNNVSVVWRVSESGSYQNQACSALSGIRPALVLPDTFGSYYVDSDGNQHAEQEYVGTLTDVLGSPATIFNRQIIDGLRIEVGSYAGTGTYGKNNPTSLTFDFKPKFVMIYRCVTDGGTSDYINATLSPIIDGFSAYSVDYSSLSYSFSDVDWSCNTVTWYSTSNALSQLNESGWEYFYIAIR